MLSQLTLRVLEEVLLNLLDEALMWLYVRSGNYDSLWSEVHLLEWEEVALNHLCVDPTHADSWSTKRSAKDLLLEIHLVLLFLQNACLIKVCFRLTLRVSRSGNIPPRLLLTSNIEKSLMEREVLKSNWSIVSVSSGLHEHRNIEDS